MVRRALLQHLLRAILVRVSARRILRSARGCKAAAGSISTRTCRACITRVAKTGQSPKIASSRRGANTSRERSCCRRPSSDPRTVRLRPSISSPSSVSFLRPPPSLARVARPAEQCLVLRRQRGLFSRSRQLFSWMFGVLRHSCMQLIAPAEQIQYTRPFITPRARETIQSSDSALLPPRCSRDRMLGVREATKHCSL